MAASSEDIEPLTEVTCSEDRMDTSEESSTSSTSPTPVSPMKIFGNFGGIIGKNYRNNIGIILRTRKKHNR